MIYLTSATSIPSVPHSLLFLFHYSFSYFTRRISEMVFPFPVCLHRRQRGTSHNHSENSR